MSVATYKLDCTQLVCLWKSVQKIDSDYYRDERLMGFPKHRRWSLGLVLQQDNAPARRACQRVQLLRRETEEFTAPDMWLPNSPDLNTVITAFW